MVELRCDPSTVASTEQGQVTVPEGSRTRAFTVNTKPVSRETPLTITASHQNVQKKVTLSVQQPTIKTFTFSPSSIPFSDVARGTIILTGPAPSNTSISLLGVNQDGDPDGVAERVAKFPATVAVPSNATRVTFEATTRGEGASISARRVRIKASYLEGTIVTEVTVEGLPT